MILPNYYPEAFYPTNGRVIMTIKHIIPSDNLSNIIKSLQKIKLSEKYNLKFQ